MAPRIGFTGIIGDEIRRDPRGTLAWAAQLGLDGMEGASSLSELLGISVAETRDYLRSLGLEAPIDGRLSQNQSDAEISAVLTTAREIGARYTADYYAPFTSREEILRYAEYSNRLGTRCAQEGLVFAYHNHAHEMKKHDGERGIEIYLANTDSTVVKVVLDVAWVAYGGADPTRIIRSYPDRFPVLHMKDLERLHPESANAQGVLKEAVFAEVGTGVVDTSGVLDAAREADVDWLIIEQDRMNKLRPKESLEASYRNLRKLVVEE